MRARVLFALLTLGVLAARLCHVGILWTEENLPLAAAAQMLHGKTLYRDVWFDKPPAAPVANLLSGAQPGWPLRAVGTAYVLACCWLAWWFARRKWGASEAAWAAFFVAFFLTFWIPAAVLPLAADLLLIAPHLAAVYLAWRGRALASGVMAGLGLLVNAKAVFAIAVCALWVWRAAPAFALGVLLPNLLAAAWLWATGSLGAYWREVWQLGLLYSGHTFVGSPLREGFARTLNWLGFHAALGAAAAWFWWKGRDSDRWRFAAWAALSLAAVTAGWRFFPRYYFQLLPVAVLAASRGMVLLGRKRALALLLLLIPLARFGPRYALLALDGGRPWSDIEMDRDSRAAAQIVRRSARPGDTLFVWGYRPDLYVYTRLPAATRFLESQPLSGVLADRHLFDTTAIPAPWTAAHRAELARSRPALVVDGLKLYNPRLALETHDDLRSWLAQYREIARTRGSVIYRRQPP
ncbi:MAG: hypothetical protein HY822_10410 [Acidobacteria bacterium]|nr:hypothetical protein [Acidobacteriota bacterium]